MHRNRQWVVGPDLKRHSEIDTSQWNCFQRGLAARARRTRLTQQAPAVAADTAIPARPIGMARTALPSLTAVAAIADQPRRSPVTASTTNTAV